MASTEEYLIGNVAIALLGLISLAFVSFGSCGSLLGYIGLAITAAGIAYQLHYYSKDPENPANLQKRVEAARIRRKEMDKQEFESARQDAARLLSGIPSQIQAAKAALSAARSEFRDRAFGPFWDCVEQSARCVAQIERDLSRIRSLQREYINRLPSVRGNGDTVIFPFPRIAGRLRGLDDTHRELRAVARRGQRDFEFATILEHRKTQIILIKGFASLGQAIDGLAISIGSSLNQLSQGLAEISRAQVSAGKQAAEVVRERQEHERKELENLRRIREHLEGR